MKRTSLFITLLMIVAASFSVSCGNRPASGSASTSSADTAVAYVLASNYFVKNTSDFKGFAVVKTREAFDSTFGMAAFMGPNGMPTSIDFGTSFVIAYSEGETDCPTELEVKSFTDDGDSTLVLETISHIGEKTTFTTVPCMLLIIDNKYLGYRTSFLNRPENK